MATLRTIRRGSRGPEVELLQLGFNRAGYLSAPPDGIFGPVTEAAVLRFQRASGLAADGIVGPRTWAALDPWLVGYTLHTVRPGDTLYSLARRYGTTLAAVELANPGVDPFSLRIGSRLTIPLGFPVVPANISFTPTVLELVTDGLTRRYPFLTAGSIGRSVMGRELTYFRMGTGPREVFYNGAHHANEWIVTPMLLRFLEEYAAAYASGGSIFGRDAAGLYAAVSLYMVPMVNPDGVALVTGELTGGSRFEEAARIGANYPFIPFPSGWKANISGVDPNLQYPAGWENARAIKFAQGFTSPAPRDYVGAASLTAPESRAVYDFTLAHDFRLTLSYHTQGRVIFWKYLDMEPPGAREIANAFSAVSGYAVEDVPVASGYAGYKDWFILEYDRPGFTIEAGSGQNPLPLSQLGAIYRENIGILTLGLTA